MRALPGSDRADVIGARIAIVAARVVGNTLGLDAVIAPCRPTGAVRPVVNADVVLAALAAGAVVIGAASTSRNADIVRTALRRAAFATDRTRGGIATRRRATPIAAAIRLIERAALVRGLAPRMGIGTTKLFPITMPDTTGVIATLAVRWRSGRYSAVATRRTTIGHALRQPRRTNAFRSIPGLLSWALDRFGSGRWPRGRIGPLLQYRPTDDSGAAEPKETLEHGATTHAAG